MRPHLRFPQPSATRRLALALATVGVMTATNTALAAPLCRTAMFNCRGAIASGINLRKAIGSKERADQVLKNCKPFYTSLEPDQCDWRKTLRLRRLGAPLRVARAEIPAPETTPTASAHAPVVYRHTPGPNGGAPTLPQPQPPQRDVRGRYSTTPAPTRIPEVTAEDRAPFAAEVRAAAARYKLPENLVRAVMKVESGYNPTVVSHAGAVGLMQLLPDTAKAMGVKDLRDPNQSILGGARFLRILANRFRGDLVKVLSAYHAGSTRVKRRGGTPYAATDSYVRKVLGVYYALQDR